MARYNTNNKNLDTEARIRWLLTLDKPERVKLSQGSITGRMARDYVVVSSPWLMAEQFANWKSDDASILRFTTQYGPLMREWIESDRFSFEPDHWRNLQRNYRQRWEKSCPATLRSDKISDPEKLRRGIKLEEPTFLQIHKGSAALLLRDMRILLDVCCTFIPIERMRMCKAEGCKKPYFAAHRLDQTLCGSDECKRWNELRLKREWFEREKGPILQERKRLRRSNDGTHKTR